MALPGRWPWQRRRMRCDDVLAEAGQHRPVLNCTDKQIVDAPTLQFQCETVDMITEEKVVEQSADILVSLVKEEIVEVVQFALQVPVQNRAKEQMLGVLFPKLQEEEIREVVPSRS